MFWHCIIKLLLKSFNFSFIFFKRNVTICLLTMWLIHQVELKYSKMTLIKTCKGGIENTEFVRTPPFPEVASWFVMTLGSSASIIAILENVAFLVCPSPSWISGLCHFTSTRKEKQAKESYKVAWNSQISITGFVKTFEKYTLCRGL